MSTLGGPFIIALLMLILGVKPLFAEQGAIMETGMHNTNPLVDIHGLPGYAPLIQVDKGEVDSGLVLDITNEFHNAEHGSEQLNFDFERARLSLFLYYGLNERFTAGIAIPYLSNDGGFLDGLIENWHDLFDLPQGGRDQAARDQFLISYRDQAQQILLDSTDRGFGDVSIFLDTRHADSERYKINSRASLKLPTGDEEQLFGSGGFSFSLNVNASRRLSQNWQVYGSAGLSVLEKAEILTNRQNTLVGSVTLGLCWQATNKLKLLTQLDLNSEVYKNSNLDAVSGQAGVLFTAAQYTFANQSVLQAGFTEDVINKDAAPDFSIRIGFNF